MTSAYWQKFFQSAGIPQPDAVDYALIFEDNRITASVLSDLRKEHLADMGIRRVGDIIGILKCASEWASVAKQQKANRTQPVEQQASAMDIQPGSHNREHQTTGHSSTTVAEKPAVKLFSNNLMGANDSRATLVATTTKVSATKSNIEQHQPEPQQRVIFTRLGELSSAGRAAATASASTLTASPSNAPSNAPSNQSGGKKLALLATNSSVFKRLGDLLPAAGGRTVLPPPPPPPPPPQKRKIPVDIDEEDLEPDDDELADLGKILAKTSRSGEKSGGGRLFLLDDGKRNEEQIVQKPLRVVDRWPTLGLSSIPSAGGGSSYTAAASSASVQLQLHQPVRKAEAHSTVDEFQQHQQMRLVDSRFGSSSGRIKISFAPPPTLYSDEVAPRSSSSSRHVAASLLKVKGSHGIPSRGDSRGSGGGGGGDRSSLVTATGRSDGSSGRRELDHRTDGYHHYSSSSNSASTGRATNSRFTRIVVQRSPH